ncbi:hypothetical protein XBI1_500005 [Xenorhabdus bovienii str. Intermedium]|uniref:Uncharacterized protein n=1 Tax=Xenorhabdus bovienii str. Intermedium TaxID=1379677 RepID=A0A077QFD9_XENBV|nr:hypothetical protein XBI1_500005 [Xenorhabdus bovienii str. Intermedium]
MEINYIFILYTISNVELTHCGKEIFFDSIKFIRGINVCLML